MMQIKNLTLYTHCLSELRRFYTSTMGLAIVGEEKNSFTLKVGSTLLSFNEASEVTYYHFAINIPSFQIEDAYSWVKERTNVLSFEGQKIVDFKDWNADALYFYDPAGNIVEFIARKNLNIHEQMKFSSNSLLNVSEIGLPVSDVGAAFELLNGTCKLEKYSGDYSRFCALGEEIGLFIIIDYNQKDWIPNGDKAQPFPFQMSFKHNQIEHKLVYKDEKLELS